MVGSCRPARSRLSRRTVAAINLRITDSTGTGLPSGKKPTAAFPFLGDEVLLRVFASGVNDFGVRLVVDADDGDNAVQSRFLVGLQTGSIRRR